MGYSNPRQIINKTNAVINSEIRRFNESFDAEFEQMNARQAENIEANMEVLKEKKMKRDMGDQEWYENVQKYRPKGGYAEDTEAFLSNMHNKYYELLSCDTAECRKELERLKTVPQQLSEVGGAWSAVHDTYEKSNNKELFSPGSFNARTPNYIQTIMENGGYTKKTYNDKTGHVEFEVYDKDGKRLTEKNKDGEEVPMIVDAPEFTKGAMAGDIKINTYGDPAAQREEFQKGIKTEMDYDGMVQKVQDDRNQYNKLGYENYSEANAMFGENLTNSDISALTSDKAAMTDSYPVMVNELFKQAKAGDAASEKALADLGVLGADNMIGGDDDLDMTNALAVQAQIPMWDNSPNQKAVAEAYFKYGKVDNMIKPDRINKTRKISKPKAPSATDIKNQQALVNAATTKEFNTNFNNQAANAKTQQEAEDFLIGLGNFEKQKTTDSKGSIQAMVARGEAEVIQNEDGSFAIQISGATKDDGEGNITGGEVRKTYNLSDPKQMNQLRSDFNIDKDNYSVNKSDQNTSGGDNKVDLNAANFNSNQTNKIKDMGGKGVLLRDDQQTTTNSTTSNNNNNSEVPPGGFANPINNLQKTYNAAASIKKGEKGYDDYERDENGIIKKDSNGAPYYSKEYSEKQNQTNEEVKASAPVVEEEVVETPELPVKEKPTKVSYGQPKDISNDRVDKVADRILTWERASGSGVNAGPHTDFGFNSGTKPKTKEEAMKRFEKEYGKKLVGGLNDEALFQAIDWNFNAGRDSKQMLLFASGLIPGTAAEQRAAINGKGNISDAELNALYKKNEAKILQFVNDNNITNKKMELYMSPKMVKKLSKTDLKTGLQKQWGPRMGMSKTEIDKWIADNFETIYNESKSLIGS